MVDGHVNGHPLSVYRGGYTAGRQAREADARERRRQDIYPLYGDWRLVDEWERGFDDAAGGPERPPDTRDPSAYVAYKEGYRAAGRGGGAAAGGPPDGVPGRARSDAVRILAELFVEQLDGMKQQSDRYYLLLEATAADAPPDPDDGPTLAESIARTRLALERTREASRRHTLFHGHALAASRVHPRRRGPGGLRREASWVSRRWAELGPAWLRERVLRRLGH